MDLRTVFGSALVAVLLSGGMAVADSRGLPGVFGIDTHAPVVRVQSDTITLQEEIRRLNGRIEELNFQILQMQEQIRKMQEDNDFRFQELESGKRTDAGPPANRRTAEAATPPAKATVPPVGGRTATASSGEPDDVSAVIAGSGATGTNPGSTTLQPRSMGTITFDQNGNVVGGGVGDQTIIEADPNGAVQQPGADNTVVAALPQTDDPDALYRASYDFMLQGQYATAEAGFADHARRFSQDARAADAHFWLGEAQLGQRKYREAAETFLAASKTYPKAKKAPDMLLKLGVSLVGLNQNEIACATFAEVGKRYPKAGAQLQARVKKEQQAAAC